MASQKANTNFSVKNNGGSVINAGATDSGVLSDLSLIKNLGSGLQAYGTSVFSDTPTAPLSFNDPRGVIKARSVNPFAYTPPAGSGYILLAAGDNASTIGGSGTTVLNIPGGATEAVINKNLKTTQFGSYATRTFNVLATPSSGNFPGLTRGTGAGTAVTYRATSGNFPAVDDAASATRAVPGELTYRFGAALPTRNVAYKAKDAAESGINL
jgi:hypothetical protein